MEELKVILINILNLMKNQTKILKENNMKTLKIATAIAALSFVSVNATADFSADADISFSGNSQTISDDGCQFRAQANGTMTRSGAVWSVGDGQAGTIQVRSRNITSIIMTSDNILRDSDGDAVPDITATVDYTGNGTAILATTTGGTLVRTATSLGVNAIPTGNGGLTNIHPRGTVTMGLTVVPTGTSVDDSQIAATEKLANETVYTINHTVECVQ